jgi:DNA-binding GntR family transcriptional regulator
MTSITGLFADLDRSGPVPLYFQVARRLEAAIEDGTLPAGTKIENEIKLAEELKLSRPTIRRAIQELVDSGLMVRRRGIGTQVVHGRITRRVELTSLYDDLDRDKKAPRTVVLLHEVVPPTAEIATALDLTDDSPILHIKRLRSADGQPLALLENFLPPEFADITRAQLEQQGLYQVLRARGATMRIAKQRIGARGAHSEEATLFERAKGSAVLTMSRTVYDNAGRAIEYGTHAYAPEAYSFEVTLVDK